VERHYLSLKLFIGAVLALYAAACVVSFGFERLMYVSVSCLISVCCDSVIVFAFWFRDEIRDAVGWRFFFNRFGLISECELMLLGIRAVVLVSMECWMGGDGSLCNYLYLNVGAFFCYCYSLLN
jgi:hypothetical protein